MTHNGYTGRKDSLNRFANLAATFHFTASAWLSFMIRIAEARGLHGVALICTERHIAYHQRTVSTLDNALGMVNHLVESHRQSGHITGHNIRCRVTNKYHVNTGLVDELGHRVVIGCKHGDFLATTFHFYQARSCHFALFVYSVCRHS